MATYTHQQLTTTKGEGEAENTSRNQQGSIDGAQIETRADSLLLMNPTASKRASSQDVANVFGRASRVQKCYHDTDIVEVVVRSDIWHENSSTIQ